MATHKTFQELLAEQVSEVETLSEKELRGLAGVLAISTAGADSRDALIACIRGSVDTGAPGAKKSTLETLADSVSQVKKGAVGSGGTAGGADAANRADGAKRPPARPARPSVRPVPRPRPPSLGTGNGTGAGTAARVPTEVAPTKPKRPPAAAPTADVYASSDDEGDGAAGAGSGADLGLGDGGGGGKAARGPKRGADANEGKVGEDEPADNDPTGAGTPGSRRRRDKWFSVKKKASGDDGSVDEVTNPLAGKKNPGADKERGSARAAESHAADAAALEEAALAPMAPMDPDKVVKHSGIATGNLALSKDQLGDVMADMLRDIESSKTGAASEGKNKDLTSAVRLVEMRQKMPKSVRRKKAASMEMDVTKRQTIIPAEFEYVASERDLEGSAMRNSEVLDFDNKARVVALNAAKDEIIPLLPPDLSISVTCTEYTVGESDDRFKLELVCGELSWQVERSLSEAAETRDALKVNPDLFGLADGFPERGTAETRSNDAAKKAKLETWVGTIVQRLTPDEAQKLDYVDEFLETFWNVEEAKRQAPARIDYMAHKDLTRETAEELLRTKAPGVYLVRKKVKRTPADGELVISCVHEDKTFWHGIVDKLPSPKRKPWTLRGTDLNHVSLDKLIEYYSTEPYSKAHGKLWNLGNFCGIKPPKEL